MGYSARLLKKPHHASRKDLTAPVPAWMSLRGKIVVCNLLCARGHNRTPQTKPEAWVTSSMRLPWSRPAFRLPDLQSLLLLNSTYTPPPPHHYLRVLPHTIAKHCKCDPGPGSNSFSIAGVCHACVHDVVAPQPHFVDSRRRPSFPFLCPRNFDPIKLMRETHLLVFAPPTSCSSPE